MTFPSLNTKGGHADLIFSPQIANRKSANFQAFQTTNNKSANFSSIGLLRRNAFLKMFGLFFGPLMGKPPKYQLHGWSAEFFLVYIMKAFYA